MSITTLATLQAQVEKFWSPLFTQELRANTLMPSLVNKDYQGAIANLGDTVRVSQIVAPAGELRTVGGVANSTDDANIFDTNVLQTLYVDIQANKRAVAAFEFAELAQLQSQLGAEDSEIRASLMYAVEKQINSYLYSLVAPDVTLASSAVTTFDASQLGSARTKAAQQKWLKNKPWYCLLDPQYYGDMLNAVTMTNSQYTQGDAPVVGGQIATQRFGFNILEDNSRAPQHALMFHPDFLHLVMQTQARFKISDQHANKKFGYIISVDLVFGAAQGIAGGLKHITVKNT